MTESPANWAAIFGRWSFSGEQITFLGPDMPDPALPLGICVTNIQLTEGRVSCRVKLPESSSEGRILLSYRSPNERYIMAGIGGWKSAYSVGEFIPGLAWVGLALAGRADNLTPGEWYTQTVELRGQKLRVSVNDVPVLRHVFDKRVTTGQVGLFAVGKNRIEFENVTVELQRGTAFVIMQFSEKYHQLYKEVISPVVEASGLSAYHVGEVFGPGLILEDVVQGIVEAQVVIA